MQQIKIVGDKHKKRTMHRITTMPTGQQFEALLDGFRVLKAQGIDIGRKMEELIDKDDKVREKYPE